jgi:23S rRNA (pseudouridine1915-N3)-methyltransferase
VKISLLYIGRPRDREANLLAEEYARRIGRYCDFQMRQVRDESSLDHYAKAYSVVLDPAGRQLSSAEFATWIEKSQNTAVRELVFLVGGADGVSESTRNRARLLLSLSKMTLPHEMARVVLAEQIYRAFAILHGHPYAK